MEFQRKGPLTYLNFLCHFAFFLFGIACKDSESLRPDRPNIVIVFTDDQGYGDLSSFGAVDFQTPHIDQMAANGLRFTSFYAAQAVCSASRAGLLTGCYPNRIGITGALMPWATHGLADSEITIAEMLRPLGYATAAFGKWHLGHLPSFLPLQHGFDEYFGLPYSNDMWPVDFDGAPISDSTHRKHRHPTLPLIEGSETIEEITTLEQQNLLTTRYTEKAVDFIRRHKHQPFFLYLPHTMAHIPLGVSEKFKGKSQQGLYGDVMMEIDWSVGQIISTLKELDLEKNTLMVFVSDNGPWLNFGNHAGSTGGLREGKGTSFEGGQRVPCVMQWPAMIAPNSVSGKLASTIDLLPTIAEITGAELPKHKIDGVSILPLLKGEVSANPREVLYYYYGRNDLEAIRYKHWKLIFPHISRSYQGVLPGNDGWPGPYRRDTVVMGLYDLRRDPGEYYDVQELYPEVIEEIMEIAEEARSDLGDRLTGVEGTGRRSPGRVTEPN
jgi:arylsulfatase